MSITKVSMMKSQPSPEKGLAVLIKIIIGVSDSKLMFGTSFALPN